MKFKDHSFFGSGHISESVLILKINIHKSILYYTGKLT